MHTASNILPIAFWALVDLISVANLARVIVGIYA